MSALPHPAVTAARFYAILDTGYAAPEQLPDLAQAALAGGAKVLQLRAKGETTAWRIRLLNTLAPLAAKAGVPLVVNDDLEAARAVAGVGLHVGQDDLAPRMARAALGPDRVIGLSTHSIEQARAAIAQTDVLTYFAVGPVFATATKPDYAAVGLELVKAVAALQPPMPWFCIGGINRKNVAQPAGGRWWRCPTCFARKTRRAWCGNWPRRWPRAAASLAHLQEKLGEVRGSQLAADAAEDYGRPLGVARGVGDRTARGVEGEEVECGEIGREVVLAPERGVNFPRDAASGKASKGTVDFPKLAGGIHQPQGGGLAVGRNRQQGENAGDLVVRRNRRDRKIPEKTGVQRASVIGFGKGLYARAKRVTRVEDEVAGKRHDGGRELWSGLDFPGAHKAAGLGGKILHAAVDGEIDWLAGADGCGS